MKKIKSQTNSEIISFIKSIYQNQKYIALHEPRFTGNEKKYLKECVDSSFVSTVESLSRLLKIKLLITLVQNMQLQPAMVLRLFILLYYWLRLAVKMR